MSNEQIKSEADRITAQYALYANGLIDGSLHKFSSIHCAILHVQGQIDLLDSYGISVALSCGEWYMVEHQKLQSVLTELKSRV